MKTKTRWSLGSCVVIVAAILIVVFLPAPDPLADVDTVAVRVGSDSPSSSSFDFESELSLVLSGRDIQVVSDEASADLVLSLDDFRVNLGDIEISLTEGTLRGKATAVCTVTDVRTGDTHTMDFVLQIENGDVRAELTGRKFWHFWK